VVDGYYDNEQGEYNFESAANFKRYLLHELTPEDVEGDITPRVIPIDRVEFDPYDLREAEDDGPEEEEDGADFTLRLHHHESDAAKADKLVQEIRSACPPLTCYHSTRERVIDVEAEDEIAYKELLGTLGKWNDTLGYIPLKTLENLRSSDATNFLVITKKFEANANSVKALADVLSKVDEKAGTATPACRFPLSPSTVLFSASSDLSWADIEKRVRSYCATVGQHSLIAMQKPPTSEKEKNQPLVWLIEKKAKSSRPRPRGHHGPSMMGYSPPHRQHKKCSMIEVAGINPSDTRTLAKLAALCGWSDDLKATAIWVHDDTGKRLAILIQVEIGAMLDRGVDLGYLAGQVSIIPADDAKYPKRGQAVYPKMFEGKTGEARVPPLPRLGQKYKGSKNISVAIETVLGEQVAKAINQISGKEGSNKGDKATGNGKAKDTEAGNGAPPLPPTRTKKVEGWQTAVGKKSPKKTQTKKKGREGRRRRPGPTPTHC
jgi:hypothetical protein